MDSDIMKELEEHLNYSFQNKELLVQALTHTSFANEAHSGHLGSNERLEFLGDAVLELVSSDFFYREKTQLSEGELTKLRASFVCEPALAYCAEQIPLSPYLLLGRGEEMTGGRTRPSIVSDAMEAVVGALYLDGGLEIARDFIERFILNDIEGKRYFYDAKTILQEEGKKPELAFKGSFNIRLSPALHKKLFLYATAHQMSINQYIEDTLEASPASKLVI